MSRAKVAVLISGRGSNLQSLIDACASDDFPAEIALVISNRPNALGIERAQKAGIAVKTIDHKAFETREAFDRELDAALKETQVNYVCLAGFMRMLTPWFVDQWRERLINIHPSLLPAFKGLNVHERMINAGVKLAGCTVHFVSTELDSGPIIGQAATFVAPTDTPETLAARILKLEHALYPSCLRVITNGKARLSGSVVRFDDDIEISGDLINPA